MADMIKDAEKLEQKQEVTAPKKKTGMQKFLNFLAMGGFLLIIIAGVIIAVAISIWVGSCQAQ